VKATSISSADLLDPAGSVVRNARPNADGAVFDLAGVTSGDYFVKVNGDAADLVPTRLDGSEGGITQRVGQKLSSSYIGSAQNPAYRFNTYSAGQGTARVVQFSDGAVIPGEQAYVVMALAARKFEVRTLGTAVTLSSLGMPGCPGHSSVPADAWLVNTRGQDHHGDLFKADGGSSECSGCHGDLSTKAPSYKDITPRRGWCFGCHFGADGVSAGFVDASR
jgi:hypothetical protein